MMFDDGGWGWALMTIAGPIILGAAIFYGASRWRRRHSSAGDAMQLGEDDRRGGGINRPHGRDAQREAERHNG